MHTFSSFRAALKHLFAQVFVPEQPGYKAEILKPARRIGKPDALLDAEAVSQ
jgi:hypothetical protein